MIIMNDLTIFIITIDNEYHNNYEFNKCYEAIKEKDKINIIKNIYPMSEAFNEMIIRCQTKYFIQVDDDMILNENSINKMYEAIINEDNKCFMLCFKLEDPEFGKISGIKIYNHDIIKNYRFKNDVNFDVLFNKEVSNDGYHYKTINEIMGTHGQYRDDFGLFRKYATYACLSHKPLEWNGSKWFNNIIAKHFYNFNKYGLSKKDLMRNFAISYGLMTKYNNDDAMNYKNIYDSYKNALDYCNKVCISENNTFNIKKLDWLK
jgi:hypothetical protein